ncbi:MAG: thymidine phosphorylase [Lachnospiraceae bacterium]|nr:thymidine phosphorylase [Lachnospiraceae bacterium]
MNMCELIDKKKRGLELSTDEIYAMISGYTRGDIPDYQMSAMTMAICFQGMSKRETLDLTLAMRDSGSVLDLSSIDGIKSDKHSTGGVGDKTSLALLPLVSALGVKVAKMSGRGLGHTGGTIDKLESIPGFNTSLDTPRFIKQVKDIGFALTGQSMALAPADKKLYALRDVTATVDQLSLIASSIMSKKLASGADSIVLDVKCGSGAFMRGQEDAEALAAAMTEIGRSAGKSVRAYITDMDQPLGNAIGNAIEVKEAILTLKGKGPADFTELVYTLGEGMLTSAGITSDSETARILMEKAISSGSALDQLARFVRAQGGDDSFIYDENRLKISQYSTNICADEDGYVTGIDCDSAGLASLALGAGREKIGDEIDHGAGIMLHKKCGDEVLEGNSLATLYSSDEGKLKAAAERLKAAYHIGKEAPGKRSVIIKEVV